MDIRLKKQKQSQESLRLAPRDPLPSASSVLLTTDKADLGKSTAIPGLDSSLKVNKSGLNHRSSVETDNSGNSTSESQSSSSSGLPNDCSSKNLPPMIPSCQFVNENDGSLHYSDGWIFSTSDPNGLVHTVHFTKTPYSSISLMFNTSNIILFGLAPSGSSPPQASYSIDGSILTSSHLAATTACIPNQQLFNSGNLAAGLHNLTIGVTMASQSQPSILDYLWLCGAGTDASESSTATVTDTHNKPSKDVILVGAMAFLGIVILLLVIMFYILLSRIRRKSQKQESDSDKNKRRTRSSSAEPDRGRDMATQPQVSVSIASSEPPLGARDVPWDEYSLLEGITLSGISNAGTGYLASTAEGDGPPSSLGPAPSTISTTLARGLDKVVQFRSPIPLQEAPTHTTGSPQHEE